MAFTLSVTEPQNSGIGGGGLLIYYEKSTNQFTFVDYMPIAPFDANEKIKEFKTPRARDQKVSKTGVLAMGVPGFVKGMDNIHQKFGKLAWGELFKEAIYHAKNGLPPLLGVSAVINR